MRTVCCLALFFGLMGYICPSGYSGETEGVKTLDTGLVDANTAFGLDLFDNLIKQNINENILISPTSLAFALSMTYNGAIGETKDAIAEAMRLQGMSLEEVNQASYALMEILNQLDDNVIINIADSLWARKGEKFKADFLERNEAFYGAQTSELDFDDPKTPSVINAWVKEKTQGKIDKIVDEIPPGVMLYLINAVYFKGIWAVKFDRQYTKERDFTLLDGSKKKVPMMTTESEKFTYFDNEGFEAVGLPYGNGRVSMYIFLPHRESSLKEFYGELSEGNWENWMSQFKQSQRALVMPRFRLEYDVILNDTLKDMGMGIAFGSDADFGNMCLGKVWIDEVIHKTYLEVNEEGTEAAAVTSVSLKKGGGYIVVDRPFFFVIRDNETGAVLFMGSVIEP